MNAEFVEQENFDKQIDDFMRRHPNYATPGAKAHWRRIKIGYILLAIGAIVGIWAVSDRNDRNLRKEINSIGITSCIAGIQTYNKFNDLVKTNISTQEQSFHLNLANGDKKRAQINRQAIKRLKSDLLVPPTVEQCQNPILK